MDTCHKDVLQRTPSLSTSSSAALLYLFLVSPHEQGTGAASFDEFGNSKYQNRRTMSSSDRAMLNAFKEISTMADRINLPRNIIVSQKFAKTMQ